VQTLKAQGKGIKPIMRELGLAKETVRRFYRAANVDELLAKPPAGRPSKLDEFKPHLHRRWNEGCTTVRTLVDEYPGPGLPRQLRNREHLPASLPCTRRGSTCRTTGAEGPPTHLLDAAPPRRYRQRRPGHTQAGPPAGTWTPPRGISLHLLRCSPGGTVIASTRG
jgi:hypothetical protein